MTRHVVMAVSGSGERHELRVEAADADDAALAVAAEGLTPLHVRTTVDTLPGSGLAARGRAHRPRVDELAAFFEPLGTLLHAGVTLEMSLSLMARRAARPAAAARARRLLKGVREGAPLSAMLEAERQVPSYVGGMVLAAERAGRLADGVADAARQLARQAGMQARLLQALSYPLFVLGTVVVALGIVLVLVVPAFAPVFQGDEHRLPLVTRAVLRLSAVTIDHGAIVLPGGAAVAGGLALAARTTTAGRRMASAFGARLPPVVLVGHLAMARVLGVLGLLLRSGMEVSEAFLLASRAAASRERRTSFAVAAGRLREGASIAAAVAGIDGLPRETADLVAIGEHTGDLGGAIARAAELLEAEASARLERWIALANPVAIVLLGTVVGGVMAGVMLGVLGINQFAGRP